jgi:hypothetical protein
MRQTTDKWIIDTLNTIKSNQALLDLKLFILKSRKNVADLDCSQDKAQYYDYLNK